MAHHPKKEYGYQYHIIYNRMLMKTLWILLLISALVLAFFFIKNKRIPTELGVRNGQLSPLPNTPNAVSSQTDNTSRYVPPWPFKSSLTDSREAVIKALGTYGGIEVISSEANYIHAVSTTSGLKFNDDLEFYFDTDTSLIHFRSSSRVGYSDLGLNRERYTRLKELYSAL
jgi:uncharacterized protein (DUF1499 family)